MRRQTFGSGGIGCVALALAGCNQSVAAPLPPAPAASVAPAASAERVIEVSPTLIEQGRIVVAQAERRVLTSEAVLAGSVVPAADGEAEVGSLVSGRVATIEVAEGAAVKRGQVLAWVDAPEVGRAVAAERLARSHLAVAERKLARQLELEKQSATSKNAVDEARAEERAAHAETGAARTALAIVGVGGAPVIADDASPIASSIRIPIRSPLDGVVIERHAVLGAAVAPEKMLFHVVDPRRLQVRAKLPETLGPLPDTGVTAEARPRASMGSLSAPSGCRLAIVARFAAVDEASRTIPILLAPIAVDRDAQGTTCGFLLPGGYVDVVLRGARPTPTEAQASVVVPADAVVDLRGTPTVFLPKDRPGRFVARSVRVGTTVGSAVSLEAGLEAGVSVVTTGAVLLKGELMRAALEGG